MTHGSLSGRRRSASYMIGNIYGIFYLIKPEDAAGLLRNFQGYLTF